MLSTTSKTSSASASDAAAEIISRFKDSLISVREQVLDANQARLLSLSLGRRSLHDGLSVEDKAPPTGTPLPPGYHLVYFTPSFLEIDLGLDGTDRSANPLHPFTRRMWAGGDLQWSKDPERMLRVGQTVTETTRILSAEPKRTKAGNEMIVVGVEKHFENKNGIALVDKRFAQSQKTLKSLLNGLSRNWVFQPEVKGTSQPSAAPERVPMPEGRCIGKLHLSNDVGPDNRIVGQYNRDLNQTAVSLFRFSALTFNAHTIHYSRDWCREVEGHRDLVVHGPLNLINILDLWRDSATPGGPEEVPSQISYRAMSPLYVNEPYRIILNPTKPVPGSSDMQWIAEAHNSYGSISMKGTILAGNDGNSTT